MTKATTRLVCNAVGIYAPGHARYNEADLYNFGLPECKRVKKKIFFQMSKPVDLPKVCSTTSSKRSFCNEAAQV